MTERRRFIATAGGALATAATRIIDTPSVIAQPKIQWRMSTAFGPAFDVHQGAAVRLAKIVEETSGGRFRIEVFPGGQIMGPFECFDAASKGTIESFMGGSYYWTSQTKEPAVEWFSTVPFGMNPEGSDFHVKNAIALERLKTEFKGKVEVIQLPVPVLRYLKKLAAEVVREESEKTPMARKVHASFTKFQALVGPWDHVAEGAYHQFVAV
jgi:TRAP-type mannitol/chloroaromatic compound transport system substrate-binding protein